jgi:hypothetical protein
MNMSKGEQTSAFSVIQTRYEDGSLPGQRTDDYNVTALFEPGAMRSIIVASEASTFALLGRRNTVDKSAGASSGGIIAACLAAEQTEEMLRTFLYRVPCPEFINLGRLVLGRNIANIEFFVRDILMQEPKLEWERVRDADIPTSVLAKSAHSGEIISFEDFNSSEDFFGAIIAATWMPRIAGWRPYVHNEHPYWDLMHNGLEHAVTDSTHVIVFRNSPEKMRRPSSLRACGVEINEIKPAKTIRRLEVRQKVLKEAVKIGAWAVIDAIEPKAEEIDAVRQSYDLLGVTI